MMVRFHLRVQKKNMKYIQSIERPAKLEIGKEVVFKLSNGTTHKGIVCRHSMRNDYYLEFDGGYNDVIFDYLELDKQPFVEGIVGYTSDGAWPETKTLEELDTVLDALLEVNRPVEEPKVEEVKKSTPSNEWDWLLG